MNKKLMAAAVAGALAVPALAFAQTASNVQLYGRVNVGLDNYSAGSATAMGGATSGANAASRNRVYDQGSRIGLRGRENLGNGMTAVFQIESGVNVDSGDNNGQAATANASSGFLASRDSYGGIEGGWGRITFGRQSVYWTSAIDQVQANYVDRGMPYTTGTFGRISSPSARTSNVMMYQSPVWSGFGFNIAYSPQSEAVVPTVGGTGTTNADGKLWGTTLLFRGGPGIVAQYDWAQKKASSIVGTPQQITTGNKLGLGWEYQPGAIVGLVWIRQTNEGAMTATGSMVAAGLAAATDRLTQTAWTLHWNHMFGNIQAMAQYGRLGKISGCSNTPAAAVLPTGATPFAGAGCDSTDGNAYMLGLKYHMSKRTGVYMTYNAIRNGTLQNSDYTGGNQSSVATGALPAGADPRTWAVGVLHNF